MVFLSSSLVCWFVCFSLPPNFLFLIEQLLIHLHLLQDTPGMMVWISDTDSDRGNNSVSDKGDDSYSIRGGNSD